MCTEIPVIVLKLVGLLLFILYLAANVWSCLCVGRRSFVTMPLWKQGTQTIKSPVFVSRMCVICRLLLTRTTFCLSLQTSLLTESIGTMNLLNMSQCGNVADGIVRAIQDPTAKGKVFEAIGFVSLG